MFSIFPSVKAASISPEPKVCWIKSWEAGGLTASQFFSEAFRWYLRTGKSTARLFLAAALVRFISGCDATPSVHNSPLVQWFNTTCFAAPADFQFGNEARVDPRLRSQGIDNFDFAVFKRTRFASSERLGVEFRTEFFNLFNRTQFAPPNTVCCSANNQNFGVVTSAAPGTNPRLVQFGLKLFF